MRISCWSSGVCSSDLQEVLLAEPGHFRCQVVDPRTDSLHRGARILDGAGKARRRFRALTELLRLIELPNTSGSRVHRLLEGRNLRHYLLEIFNRPIEVGLELFGPNVGRGGDLVDRGQRLLQLGMDRVNCRSDVATLSQEPDVDNGGVRVTRPGRTAGR